MDPVGKICGNIGIIRECPVRIGVNGEELSEKESGEIIREDSGIRVALLHLLPERCCGFRGDPADRMETEKRLSALPGCKEIPDVFGTENIIGGIGEEKMGGAFPGGPGSCLRERKPAGRIFVQEFPEIFRLMQKKVRLTKKRSGVSAFGTEDKIGHDMSPGQNLHAAAGKIFRSGNGAADRQLQNKIGTGLQNGPGTLLFGKYGGNAALCEVSAYDGNDGPCIRDAAGLLQNVAVPVMKRIALHNDSGNRGRSGSGDGRFFGYVIFDCFLYFHSEIHYTARPVLK